MIKPSDPNPIGTFLHNFRTACDRNGIYDEAAVSPFPHFRKEPAKAVLLYELCAT